MGYSFLVDELKKKAVVSLHRANWDVRAIAEVLNLEARTVTEILKRRSY